MNKPEDIILTPKIPHKLLRQMDSSFEEILLELSKLMSDEMLKEIASADYGYKEGECYKDLKKITLTQKVPSKPEFILIECLELTLWSEPNNEREHVCRAFSCVLLLILEKKSEYYPIGEISNILAPLVDSIIFLKIAQTSTQKLIVWKILDDYHKELDYYLEEDEDIEEISINPFLIYSLLLMMIINREEGKNIDKIVNWSIDMEKAEKNLPPFYSKYREKYVNAKDLEKPYLLNTSGNFDQYHSLWVEISKKMLNFIRLNYPELTNNKLKDILDCIGNRKAMNF